MTSDGWAAAYGFSQAVRAGDLLLCSGQIGQEADGSVPGLHFWAMPALPGPRSAWRRSGTRKRWSR